MQKFIVPVFGLVLSLNASFASCPAELEAVRLVSFDQATELERSNGAKSTLTLMEFAVSSNGCTESDDFEIISENLNGIQKVCVIRKNEDVCKAVVSEKIVKLETKILKKSNSGAIVLLNPIKASGVFHQAGETMNVKLTEATSVQLGSDYVGFETQSVTGSYASHNAVSLELKRDGQLVTGTYTAQRMGEKVSYQVSAEYQDGIFSNVKLFLSKSSIEMNSGWSGWGSHSMCSALEGVFILSAEGKILTGNFSTPGKTENSLCDFQISLTQVFKPMSACQAGYVWNGSACVYVGSPAQQPGVCAPGHIWNGVECVPADSNRCPGGSIFNGTNCVCPSGTVWNPSAHKCEVQTSNCVFWWNGRCLY